MAIFELFYYFHNYSLGLSFGALKRWPSLIMKRMNQNPIVLVHQKSKYAHLLVETF